MPTYTHKISKSRFVSGVQCEKKLYFDLFRKDLKLPVSDEQQALFDGGHKIGALAQQVFPGGNDATPESYFDFSDSIENTKKWIGAGAQTIYEAAFFYDEVMAALDILHHQNAERWAIEVKSSTSVKEYHITDASLQYWVMCHSGFTPDKFFLMHIDNTYVKQGPIIPKEFFTLEDITEMVIANQDWVAQNLSTLKLITKDKEPVVEIGAHCSDPFECDYTHHCWKHIPENSVFELGNARGKQWELYADGILELSKTPEDIPLNHRQSLQVEGVKNGTSYLDKDSISDFLEAWCYPLYFFDFETIFPSIPVLDGTRPYQQVPFQYSLHIMPAPNAKMIHKEFLAIPSDFSDSGAKDPRKSLVAQLKLQIGAEGSIVAYNAGFEKGVLNNLAIAFPEEAPFIEDLVSRFVDLLVVFRNAWYYKPEMGASASIKSVLPAIDATFSYDDLDIGDGNAASAIFLSMIEGTFTGNESETRNALLKYCERDTEGMVVIWNALIKLIKT